MNVVELDKVTIRVGGRSVLSNVSFSVGDAEFIGVLGPNGAGKTTLMRTLLGLIRPTGGTVRVLGKSPMRGNPEIGYLPQMRTVTPELGMRGIDFIASSVNGERWGLAITTRADRRVIEQTLMAVGATALADRPLSDMSGGERQRLLLAQALLGSPRLLLLDEPLISLDPRHQEAVIHMVRDIGRALRMSVLFSAHEINPLLGALDRLLYLGGTHAAIGSVDEVISGPVLSRLYESEIEVVRLHGRIFVMSAGHDLEHDAHRHDAHGHDAHAHDAHAHDAP